MKTLITFCALLLAALAHAANPAFTDFFGTNGIVIRTNGNKVQVDGAALASTNGLSNANIWTNDTTFIRPFSAPIATNANIRNSDGSLFSGLGTDGYLTTLGLTKSSATYFPLMSMGATNELDWEFHVGQLISAVSFASGALAVSGSYNPANSEVNTLASIKAWGLANNTTINLEAQNLSGNNYATVNLNTPTGETIELLASTQLGAKILLGSVFAVTNNGNISLIRNIAYGWPQAQGFYDSFLRNDGTGALDWTNALQNLTIVSNFTVFQNTVLSNVTVKGDLFVTNFFIGGANVRTNQYTTNISGTPVIGSMWWDGTLGTFVTNGQRRASLEWIPTNQSMRIGSVGNLGIVTHPTIFTSNFWDSPFVGRYSYSFGSNHLVNADYSAILSGYQSIVYTNASNSVISGGFNNNIKTNSYGSAIGGGENNVIHNTAQYSVIAGGSSGAISSGANNSTISGGASGLIAQLASSSTIGGGNDNAINTASASSSTISGGRNNRIGSADSTVSGGHANIIYSLGAAATIAGGDGNTVGDAINQGSTFSSIGGGSANIIDGFGNTLGYCVIGGGQQNHMEAGNNWSVIGGGFKNDHIGASKNGSIIPGGVSNAVNGAYATAIGSYITNSTDAVVDIGYGSEGGNNRKLRVGVSGARLMTYNGSATVGGTYLITNTPIASAGAAETNLHVVTVGAHVLTNANDRLLVRASGRFAATSNTKQVQLVFGSEDVFDSGAFVANTGAYTLDCEIIRTGNTAQSCNCSFNGGTNVVYVRTSSLNLAQTNGIATVLKITGTAAGDGDITNRTMTVEWRPSP